MRKVLIVALIGCGQDVARGPAPAPQVQTPSVDATAPLVLDAFTFRLLGALFVDEVGGTTYRASRHWTRPLYRIVFPIGPKLGPWPRLTERGFEGLTATQMASPAVLRKAFTGVQVVDDEPQVHLLDADDKELVKLYVDDGRASTVTVYEAGIETVHGLRVGAPLAEVLTLREPHRCQQIGQPSTSGTRVYGAIRCWVGRDERLRYAVALEPRPFGGSPFDRPTDDIPGDGPALDRWIAASGRNIEMIIWER